MPLIKGFRDLSKRTNEGYFPNELTTWDHYGNSSGAYFTITGIGGVSLGTTSGLNNTGAAVFADENAGYWRIDHTDALRLADRSAWTIDFFVRIDSDSTSTTNFQTAHEGVIFASGEGGLLTDDGSTRTVDYAGTIDANRKFKFYYNDGASLNSITSTTTIGVDDWFDVKILYENSEIKIYINGTLDSTTSASAGVTNTSNNFVLGGNSTGDYLINARIDAFRIRRDAFTTANLPTGLSVKKWNSIIDTVEYSGWDENVLLALAFNEGAGNAPKPRQTKLIPQTWEDWNYWFQVPEINIEATLILTAQRNSTGFLNTNLQTSDGFICAYGAGNFRLLNLGSTANDRQWRPDYNSVSLDDSNDYGHACHFTYGDPLGPLETETGYIGLVSFYKAGTNIPGTFFGGGVPLSSVTQRLVIPARGFLPLNQRTESINALDTTKVDSVSADAQYNQGMRPRGIKRGSIRLDTSTFRDEIIVSDNTNQRFYHGLPYFTTTDGSNTYEGQGYSYTDVSSGTINNKHDHDFRLGNTNTKIIKSISTDATPTITTHDAHGLSTGDKILIRPGYSGKFKSYPFGSGTTTDHADAMHLHGQAYVSVIDSTSFDIYYDSGLTNQITMSTTGTFFNVPGYIITPNTAGEPYIKDLGHKMVHWTSNFGDISSVESDTPITQYPTGQNQGPFNFNAARGTGYITQFGTQTQFISVQNTDYARTGLIGVSFDDVKSIPKGDANDPIVISTATTGITDSTGAMMAMVMLDLDLPRDGTLSVSVSNIDTADSTTPQIEYYYTLNGVRENGTGTVTQNTDADGVFNIAITGESSMETDDLRSIQLCMGLKDVVHASSNDTSRATYSVSFQASDASQESRIFWAGGHPPGYETLPAGPYFANEGTSFNGVIRRRSNIIYKSFDDTAKFSVSGIPDVILTNNGETYVAPANTPAGQFYSVDDYYVLEDVDETRTTKPVSISRDDIAPWVGNATMVKGQQRLYRGKRYECLRGHVSSVDEFSIDATYRGYWKQV